MNRIRDLYRDKTIIIIGNASSLIGKGKGRIIESYDIIVRLNKGWPKYPEDLGIRTDAWSFSCSCLCDKFCHELADTPIKLFLNPRLYSPNIPKDFIQNDMESYREFIKQLGYRRPSTGCITIDFFSRHIPYKSLSIIGFDFFKSGTWYGGKGPHQGGLEEAYIRKIPEIEIL